MLMARDRKNPASHALRSIPLLIFAWPRQSAKPASKKPAMTRVHQFIFNVFGEDREYCGCPADGILRISDVMITLKPQFVS
jgi:hypothetical protein